MYHGVKKLSKCTLAEEIKLNILRLKKLDCIYFGHGCLKLTYYTLAAEVESRYSTVVCKHSGSTGIGVSVLARVQKLVPHSNNKLM